jgi:hypothetical protein
VLLDATDLTLDEVIDTITRLARERSALACAGGDKQLIPNGHGRLSSLHGSLGEGAE